MSHEVWQEYYERLATLITEHRTTLVFVNTRKMAERLARELADRLGEDQVAAHHGSLSKERRFDAEARLKHGQVKVVVATASLELGIDVGHIDLVCQIGSPRRIAVLLQRIGRAGHTIHGTAKGRIFPETRDDLVECAALLVAVRRGELDRLVSFDAPLDVLAQQIVAEAACCDCREDELFATGAPGLAVPCPESRGLRRGGSHAGQRLHGAPRATRGVAPPRRGPVAPDRAARRAFDGPHLAAVRFPTTPIIGWCSSRTTCSWARSTRTSPSKAMPAMYFSSATARGRSSR